MDQVHWGSPWTRGQQNVPLHGQYKYGLWIADCGLQTADLGIKRGLSIMYTDWV